MCSCRSKESKEKLMVCRTNSTVALLDLTSDGTHPTVPPLGKPSVEAHPSPTTGKLSCEIYAKLPPLGKPSYERHPIDPPLGKTFYETYSTFPPLGVTSYETQSVPVLWTVNIQNSSNDPAIRK